MEATGETEGKYSYWRTDKAKEDGFSHELISFQSNQLLDRTDLDTLSVEPYPGINTLSKAHKRNVEMIPDAPYLGTRNGTEYTWRSWKEVYETSENMSHGMVELKLCPETEHEENGKKYRFFGIQSKNRYEWQVLCNAGMHQGLTNVPLYDTLGVEASRFCLEQCEIATMCCPKELVAKVCALKSGDTDGQLVKFVNLMVFEDEVEQDETLCQTIKDAGLNLFTFNGVIAKGAEVKAAGSATTKDAEPKDVYMLSYTSGTTGMPKGVMLTHEMVMNCAKAIIDRCGDSNFKAFDKDDTYISYLPAAHSFEQCMHATSIVYQLKCGFFSGDVTQLTADCAILKPTLFPSVPRLYNRIFGMLNLKFKSGTPEEVEGIKKALDGKLAMLHAGKGVVHEQLDAAVFSKVRPLLGGCVRGLMTGSAPISAEVMDFFKVCFSCEFIEGYGMTENCGAAFATRPADPQTGHVGGPFQHMKLRLRDVPEMNHLHTNETPEGEILLSGGSIMPGYYRLPEKTAEAIKDGWLYTGDVGRVLPNGSLKVIDRVKNIFKLSQGEYIAPEKLENVFIQSDFIVACWIYGDSMKDYVIGFCVVEPLVLKKVFQTEDVNDELLARDDVKQAVLDSMCALAAKNNFSSLEKPKQITLLAKPFNEINEDLLTPTFKMKRNVAKVFFKDQIDKMYAMPPMAATKK